MNNLPQEDEEVVEVIVLPEDGLCEGCGDPLDGEAFETDDMVVLCRPCYDLCVAEAEATDAR